MLLDPWILHQLTDSALPTGAFAHSAGLEAAVLLGRVRAPEDLFTFAEEALWATGAFALPFLLAARADPDSRAALDARCDAALPGHVANRASRAQGQALLRAVAGLSPSLQRVAEEVRRSRDPGHLAPVFGAVLGLLGADEEEAARVFLFGSARTILSAGVRLGVVGPLESQALLARCGAVAAAVAAHGRPADPRAAAATNPLVDLLQAHQDRLYSKLFQS